MISVFLWIMLAVVPASMMAQSAGEGLVTGTVYDASNGQPVPQVKVQVVEMPEIEVVTTMDGTIRIPLAPGTYSVKLTAEKYLPAEVTEIVVIAGEVADASTVMALASEVTTIEVVERIEAVSATAETMVAERRLAETVMDTISQEEIKAGTASDAAGALQKVTGVSVVSGGYVYVRGLGERYSATRLNNSMLATTEPDKRVIPLDLFPASLIDNVKVIKTYTPDLPAEFSGGLVDIQTTQFPTQPVMSVSASVGFNTRTTFEPWLDYPGGGRDWTGFDDGTRALPDILPTGVRIAPGAFTPEELQQFGRAFDNNWEPVAQNNAPRPEMSYGFVAGNTWGKLGLIGAVTYSSTFQTFNELRRFYSLSQGAPVIFSDYDYDSHQSGVRIGGLLNVAYQFSPAHKIQVRNLITRDTDDESRLVSGWNRNLDANVILKRLRWVERGMYNTQVQGEHVLPSLAQSVFGWHFNWSNATRDEPDMRDTVYRELEGGRGFAFHNTAQNGQRFFSDLNDTIYQPGGDWRLPFYRKGITGILRLGFDASIRDRDFSGLRFRMFPIDLRTVNVFEPPNVLLRPENIRPNGFELRDATQPTDEYMATMDVYSGYAMVDLSFGGKWRFVGGLRVEDAFQNVVTNDPLTPQPVPTEATLSNRDYLPAANIIYAVTSRMNLRFGFSETLSRPDFRELSPYAFPTLFGGRNIIGNPDLERAKIRNFDGRWEWFPGGGQLIAASVFYKDFKSPIEQTIQPTTDFRTSYTNADGAKNYGFELEFRRNLAFISGAMRDFSVSSNYTFVESNIRLSDDQATFVTSQERPMQGQSRHVFNAGGEWLKPQWRSTARMYFNSVSRRISDVGALGLGDIYEERNNMLDFVYKLDLMESGKWSLKFSLENLLDNKWEWTQDGLPFQVYNLGRSFSVGTSYQIF